MQKKKWARLLAYVTGLVNQQLLLQNEYLAAENRILRSYLPARLRLATEAIRIERGAHGIGMQVQFRRNDADFPMLGMKEMADASDLFIRNHTSPREKD
jgi:hypothetical protein